MPARRRLSRLAPIAPVRSACALCWCVLFACVCCLLPIAGCVSEKQERFQQFTSDGIHLFQRGDYVGARDNFEVALTLEPKDEIGRAHV